MDGNLYHLSYNTRNSVYLCFKKFYRVVYYLCEKVVWIEDMFGSEIIIIIIIIIIKSNNFNLG
jgi:hypothetical protein